MTNTAPLTTLADVFVPLIVWQLPAMALALLPIVVVEAAIARWRLSIRFGQAFKGMLAANLASTLVGIPLAWLVMFAVQLLTAGGEMHGLGSASAIFKSVVLQAAWPAPPGSHGLWMIPTATLVLLVPYFLVSVLFERAVLVGMWRDQPRGRVTSVAWLANAASYAGLAILVVTWLLLPDSVVP